MAKEYKLTQARLHELEEELIYLKTTREKEVEELIREARSFGDLSENSEYDEAKNQQSKLYGRIAEVEDILQHASVIDDTEENTGVVTLGTTVTVRDVEFDEESTFVIVGSQESDPGAGKISDDSPLGRAVVGHVAGDVVDVEAPVGTVQFQIVKVER